MVHTKKNLKRKKWEGFLKVGPHLDYFLRSSTLKVGYRMLKSPRLKSAEWRIIILNGSKEHVIRNAPCVHLNRTFIKTRVAWCSPHLDLFFFFLP